MVESWQIVYQRLFCNNYCHQLKTLIGAILIFVMFQTAVASSVEDNDPEFEVDRVAAAALSVGLLPPW